MTVSAGPYRYQCGECGRKGVLIFDANPRDMRWTMRHTFGWHIDPRDPDRTLCADCYANMKQEVPRWR